MAVVKVHICYFFLASLPFATVDYHVALCSVQLSYPALLQVGHFVQSAPLLLRTLLLQSDLLYGALL